MDLFETTPDMVEAARHFQRISKLSGEGEETSPRFTSVVTCGAGSGSEGRRDQFDL